jgi:hypothetical protein
MLTNSTMPSRWAICPLANSSLWRFQNPRQQTPLPGVEWWHSRKQDDLNEWPPPPEGIARL